MPIDHQNRLAVVTGGANGIGFEIVKTLAEDGADIAILDLVDTSEAVKAVEGLGRRAAGFECDVTDVDSVAAASKAVAEQLGTASILVNNVGIYPYTSFAETDLALWRKVMAINLDSAFIVSKAFVPGMCEQRWGRIINISSNTVHGGDYPNYVHYITSKAGVIGFTRSLASELGPDEITVNGIAPGLTQTKNMSENRPADVFDEVAQTQSIKRPQQPTDVAGAVSFLASESAGFITGQTIPVDGGFARV